VGVSLGLSNRIRQYNRGSCKTWLYCSCGLANEKLLRLATNTRGASTKMAMSDEPPWVSYLPASDDGATDQQELDKVIQQAVAMHGGVKLGTKQEITTAHVYNVRQISKSLRESDLSIPVRMEVWPDIVVVARKPCRTASTPLASTCCLSCPQWQGGVQWTLVVFCPGERKAPFSVYHCSKADFVKATVKLVGITIGGQQTYIPLARACTT
jgi:hypothetical protein